MEMELTSKQRLAVEFFAIPRDERPMTIESFSQNVIGVDDRTVRNWAKKENFKQAVSEARKAYNSRQGNLFERVVKNKALQVLYKSLDELSDKDKARKAAQGILKELKDVPLQGETVSYKGYSDEQLVAVMMKRGLNLPDAELEELKKVIGK